MKRKIPLLFLLLTIHLFLLINLRFTAWPEMLSYPYLRNNGFLLYKDMIHPYSPILTMVLSYIYLIFGYKLIVLKAFTWILILTNSLLIYFVGSKFSKGKNGAIFAVLMYVLTQPFLDGNMLWPDFAITTPLLLSAFFLIDSQKNKKHLKKDLFLVGLFLAIAIFIKQTAGLFLIAIYCYLIIKKVKFKNYIFVLMGPVILGISLLVRLIQENALTDFLNWVFVHPTRYWSKFPGYVQMNISRRDLFLLAILFLPLLFCVKKTFKKIRKTEIFQTLAIYLVISLLAVYPRFSFFHFQPALCFLPLLYLLVLNYQNKKTVARKVCFLTPILILIYIVIPVIKTNWRIETRFWGENEIEQAKIISDLTSNDEKVFLLGPFSSLYVFSERIPPKRWFDNFGWYLETPGVQEEILGRWGTGGPDKIFWQQPREGVWYEPGVYQPTRIAAYIKENYNKVDEPINGVELWEKI